MTGGAYEAMNQSGSSPSNRSFLSSRRWICRARRRRQRAIEGQEVQVVALHLDLEASSVSASPTVDQGAASDARGPCRNTRSRPSRWTSVVPTSGGSCHAIAPRVMVVVSTAKVSLANWSSWPTAAP